MCSLTPAHAHLPHWHAHINELPHMHAADLRPVTADTHTHTDTRRRARPHAPGVVPDGHKAAARPPTPPRGRAVAQARVRGQT